MGLIQWIKLGMDLQDFLAFVENYLFKFSQCEGGLQIQASYWGVTLFIGVLYVYRRYLVAKIAKLRLTQQR